MTESLDKALSIIDNIVKQLDEGKKGAVSSRVTEGSGAPVAPAAPGTGDSQQAGEGQPAPKQQQKKEKKEKKKAPADASKKPWLKDALASAAAPAADPFQQADLRVRACFPKNCNTRVILSRATVTIDRITKGSSADKTSARCVGGYQHV